MPAITELAKARGIAVMIDNSWATPVYFKPLAHGVDLSIQAATKYISGHSDAMLGVTTAPDRRTYEKLKTGHVLMGQAAGSEEMFLGLRGLRTLPLRLERHGRTGLALADWLKSRPEVQAVQHPALPGDRGYDLWKRDFTGCCGLFGVLLKPYSRAAVTAMVEGMSLFRMGWSWGGFESLIVPGFHLPTTHQTRLGTRRATAPACRPGRYRRPEGRPGRGVRAARRRPLSQAMQAHGRSKRSILLFQSPKLD